MIGIIVKSNFNLLTNEDAKAFSSNKANSNWKWKFFEALLVSYIITTTYY